MAHPTGQIEENAAPPSQHGNPDPSRLLGSWLRYKINTAQGKRQLKKDKFIKKGTRYDIPYLGGGRGSHHNP